jgi:Flp pilus assembly pilin Flp
VAVLVVVAAIVAVVLYAMGSQIGNVFSNVAAAMNSQ